MDPSDDVEDDDWPDTLSFRNEASQQFQKAIRALRLTSLKLVDVDFMHDYSDPTFLSDHDVGNLAQLRCFLP